MAPAKTLAPLGATVQDYTAGRAFLLRTALPLALALLCCCAGLALAPCARLPLAAAARLCARAQGWPRLRQALLVGAGLGAAALALGLWALREIAAWLPSVPEPCYELVRRAGGGGGQQQRLQPPRGLPLAARAAWEVAATADPAARAALVLRARYSDRLGNNLFQYVHARLRAAFLDVAFEAPPLGAPFSAAAVRVERWGCGGGGRPAHAQQLRGEAAGGPGWQAAWRAWLLEPTCRYSMNTRLLAGFEAQVAGWLRPCLDALPPPPPAAALPAWGPRDVAIHVRLGDILWGHHAAYRPLPMAFYWAALQAVAARLDGGGSSSEGLGRVVLVGEGAAQAALVARMAAALRDPGAAHARGGGLRLAAVEVHAGGSVGEDLRLLASAPALVLSVSSFSWWAAFLARGGGGGGGGGRVRTVVLPQWGLLLPHAWQPSPTHDPDFVVQQCMALAAYPRGEAGEEEEAGAGLRRLEAALRRALPSLGAPRAFPSSAAVVEVPLPELPCWGGHTKEALDALFA